MDFSMRGASALLLSLGLVVAACGHSHEEEPVHDGTSATSDEGLLTISFTADPTPVRRGSHVFAFVINNAEGKPLDGADVSPEVYQPGVAPGPDQPTTIPEGAGKYRVENVVFTQAGEWRMTVHVTKHDGSGLHDHATFRFDIP